MTIFYKKTVLSQYFNSQEGLKHIKTYYNFRQSSKTFLVAMTTQFHQSVSRKTLFGDAAVPKSRHFQSFKGKLGQMKTCFVSKMVLFHKKAMLSQDLKYFPNGAMKAQENNDQFYVTCYNFLQSNKTHLLAMTTNPCQSRGQKLYLDIQHQLKKYIFKSLKGKFGRIKIP